MPSVLTIGNFDGVHVGHRAIMAKARAIADDRGAEVVAMTFEPHPAAVLRPNAVPPRLCSASQKQARLCEAGADRVVILEPTAELLGLTAEAFVDRIIAEHHPVAFVEGEDFRFGKGRSGDVAMLQRIGEQRGFEVIIAEEVDVTLANLHVAPVGSSLTRWLIGRGRVADAARCLGRPFELTATVTRGEQRGRTIGIPTANLDLAELDGHILPADGVYAGTATIHGSGPEYPAAISVGVKPTFGRKQLTIEAHLLDYHPDDPDALYGQAITLAFERWVRDQYPFPGPESLVRQLKRDLVIVRQGYATAEPIQP